MSSTSTTYQKKNVKYNVRLHFYVMFVVYCFFFSLFGLRKSMKSLLQYNSERHCARNHTMHVDLCASNGAGHSSVCSCVRIIAPLDLEKVPESQFTQPSKFSCLLLQPGTIWSSCTNGSSNSHNIETEVCSLQEKAMLVHFTL